MRLSLTLALLTYSFCLVMGQSASSYAVQVYAVVQTDPPQITLQWPEVPSNNYVVHRKLKSGTTWGSTFAQLPGTATSFVDTTVMKHVSYEYRITRTTNTYVGYGYINAGIEIPEATLHGGIILLVDSTLAGPLAPELIRLENDLLMDGWNVARIDITPDVSARIVKQRIIEKYNTAFGFYNSVFIIGHIAVPYSGNIAPDGHNDHGGAWPADVYYADINGDWTDVTVNSTTASDPRNRNVPGDGKFDQSNLPSNVELQVGRIDFSNLSLLGMDEPETTIALTRRYLDRNHAFRNRQFVPEYRAVIDDNFGSFGGEAFAASAYRSFAPLVGAANVIDDDYRTSLSAGSYVLSYGCGGGSYMGCDGVGTSALLAGDSLRTIFTMLFGSYFGDWDNPNNLMRTALAQGTTLAISWSGRPNWMLHHLGLGENIGYAARLTQNNSTLYSGNVGVRMIHVALLGDPTLRLHYVAAPTELNVTLAEKMHAVLTWRPAQDAVAGYHVFRLSPDGGMTEQLTSEWLTDTTFVDSCLLDAGTYTYFVRSVALQETPSGTYYNLSSGTGQTITVTGDNSVIADFLFVLNGDSLQIAENTSVNASTYFWDFGDGTTSEETTPSHFYDSTGHYVITLIASSACDRDTVWYEIDIVSTVEESVLDRIMLWPNPAGDQLFIHALPSADKYRLSILGMHGSVVREMDCSGSVALNVGDLPRGLYFVRMSAQSGHVKTFRIVFQ